ncbi:lysophospholipid acyltransferase family protein [Demetria terragena]|uniref:lysophospholipid acyltransferase family protein n=1 Tax=Demetria terragena TaxID=63959 RepID=UPI000380F060|nr:lysophospholipid acyltransferase family protein [Demetria terragena]
MRAVATVKDNLKPKALKNAAGFTLVWVTAKIAHRVRFTHSAHLPRSGPVLIVANHLSMSEALAVARLTIGHRRFPHFLAMAEVFSWPVVGTLARWTGQIPVERGTAAAAGSLQAAAERLELGQVVVLYPEGQLTKQPDLRPGPGRTGAARLALAHPQVPVIPIGQWGPRPGNRHLWHRHTTRLVVGAPLDLSPWAGRADDPEAVRAATDLTMSTITALVEIARGEEFDEPTPVEPTGTQ